MADLDKERTVSVVDYDCWILFIPPVPAASSDISIITTTGPLGRSHLRLLSFPPDQAVMQERAKMLWQLDKLVDMPRAYHRINPVSKQLMDIRLQPSVVHFLARRGRPSHREVTFRVDTS